MRAQLLSFAIFLSVFSLLMFFAQWYLHRRLLKPADLSPKLKKVLRVILIVLVFLPIVAAPLRLVGGLLTDIFAWISYISLGFIAILCFTSFARDAVHYLHELLVRLAEWKAGRAAPEGNLISRRDFLSNGVNKGVIGVTSLHVGFGLYEARRTPEVVKVTVPSPLVPPSFDGFTIAQISDIHVGPTIKRSYLTDVVETVNSLNADLAVITGDVVDGSVPDLRQHTAPLADIKAVHGTFLITGNHEYYSGPDEWVEEFRRLGITVLLNENRKISRGKGKKTEHINLAGVTDLQGGRFDKRHESRPDLAMKNLSATDFNILLAHNPRSLFEAEKLPVNLMLSGHTHAGQFFPWNLLVNLVYPYAKGLHFHDKKLWVYVNAGTGYWGPPLRTGVPSEITHITLKRSNSPA